MIYGMAIDDGWSADSVLKDMPSLRKIIFLQLPLLLLQILIVHLLIFLLYYDFSLSCVCYLEEYY